MCLIEWCDEKNWLSRRATNPMWRQSISWNCFFFIHKLLQLTGNSQVCENCQRIWGAAYLLHNLYIFQKAILDNLMMKRHEPEYCKLFTLLTDSTPAAKIPKNKMSNKMVNFLAKMTRETSVVGTVLKTFSICISFSRVQLNRKQILWKRSNSAKCTFVQWMQV